MDVVGAAHVGLVLLSAALWRANWFSRLGPEMAKGQWGVASRNGNLMFRRMLCVGLWMESMWQTEHLLQVALFSVSVSLCVHFPSPTPCLSISLLLPYSFSPFILLIVLPAKFPRHFENMLVALFFPFGFWSDVRLKLWSVGPNKNGELCRIWFVTNINLNPMIVCTLRPVLQPGIGLQGDA